VLGLAFGLAVVIGGAVGQGIMRSPGLVAAGAGTAWAILAVWVAAGLLAAIDACAVVELGASHPCAGGPYAFARRAFGPLAGTMLGWTDWLQGTVAMGFIAVVFGEYLHTLGLGGGLPLGGLAALLIVAVTAINWTGTRISGASQTAFTVFKAVLLAGLVLALIAAPAPEAALPAVVGPVTTFAGLVVAMRAAVTTYSGWNGSCYFCEEMHAPERNLARSIFGGLALISLLYVLVNAALLAVLTPAQIAASKLPAADALQATWGGSSGTVITLLALVSIAAITNLYAMGFTRVTHAMARDRALPAWLARVAPQGTPRPALLLTSGTAAPFAASGDYDALIAMAAVPTATINLVMDFAAIRLRRTEPGLARPFRMPLFPLPALVSAALNTALIAEMIWESPGNSLAGVAVLLGIGLVYLVRERMAPAPA
jgi:APA family basic amino acid/polyamine antiporter